MPAHLLPSALCEREPRKRKAGLSVAIVIGCAVLSSCAPADQFFDPGPKPALNVTPVPPRVPSPDHRAPLAARPQQEPQRMAAAARRRPKAALKPAQLTGLDPKAMSMLLGRPSSIKKSDVKYVWAYDGPSCELRVVFYPDIQTKQFHVLQAAVVDAAGKPLANTAPCLRGIRSR